MARRPWVAGARPGKQRLPHLHLPPPSAPSVNVPCCAQQGNGGRSSLGPWPPGCSGDYPGGTEGAGGPEKPQLGLGRLSRGAMLGAHRKETLGGGRGAISQGSPAREGALFGDGARCQARPGLLSLEGGRTARRRARTPVCKRCFLGCEQRPHSPEPLHPSEHTTPLWPPSITAPAPPPPRPHP